MNNVILLNPIQTSHLQQGSLLKTAEPVGFFDLQIESVSKTITPSKHPLLL